MYFQCHLTSTRFCKHAVVYKKGIQAREASHKSSYLQKFTLLKHYIPSQAPLLVTQEKLFFSTFQESPMAMWWAMLILWFLGHQAFMVSVSAVHWPSEDTDDDPGRHDSERGLLGRLTNYGAGYGGGGGGLGSGPGGGLGSGPGGGGYGSDQGGGYGGGGGFGGGIPMPGKGGGGGGGSGSYGPGGRYGGGVGVGIGGGGSFGAMIGGGGTFGGGIGVGSGPGVVEGSAKILGTRKGLDRDVKLYQKIRS